MKETRILYFALGVLVVVSVGAVSLHDTGVEFPDGSFQKTAFGFTATQAVQNRVFVSSLGGFQSCTAQAVLYSVPAGKRLVIEWISAETSILGGAPSTHPVDVNVFTHDGFGHVYHPLTQLKDPMMLGESVTLGARWSSQVRLYSEASQDFKVYMCFDHLFEFQESVGFVSFSGYLIDV